jgi:lactoylglutathione lyase
MTSTSPLLGWVLLYVDDVPAAADFYTEAFGLVVRFQHESGTYTEMETGSTALALCSRALASESTGLDLVGGQNGQPCRNITLVYDDVPGAYAKAIATGATSIHEPVTKPWGQVSSYVQDRDGNLIELASTINA